MNSKFKDTMTHPVVLVAIGLNVLATFMPKQVLKMAKYSIPSLVIAAMVVRGMESRGKIGVYFGFKVSSMIDALLLTFVMQAAFIQDAVLTATNPSTVDSNGRKMARGLFSIGSVVFYLHLNRLGNKDYNLKASPSLTPSQTPFIANRNNDSAVRIGDSTLLLSPKQRQKLIMQGFKFN